LAASVTVAIAVGQVLNEAFGTKAGSNCLWCAVAEQMLEHVLDSLVVNAHMTIHIVQLHPNPNVQDTVDAVAIAFGRALKYSSTISRYRDEKMIEQMDVLRDRVSYFVSGK
jgi:imidazoleglycerol phosphate dehydratase HisB